MRNQFTDIYLSEPKRKGLTVTGIYSQLYDFPLAELEDDLPMFSAVIAEELSKQITPTQLRRFYAYVKSIEIKNHNLKDDDDIRDKAKLKFLLPKLAGSVEKKSQEGIKVLHNVFANCLYDNRINKVKDLRLLMDFFEAILDYHATFETKSNKD